MNARKVVIISSLTILIPLLLMKGCQSFARTIYNSMDCNQFNIDHIELRTGIDVPKIKRKYCQLNDSNRTVEFEVLLNSEEIKSYSTKYFHWDAPLFTAQGRRSDTQWQASLDTSTRALIFNINYFGE